MSQSKRNIISLIINSFIFVAAFVSWIFMIFGDGSNTLSSQGLGSLKFFTVLSNLYMGIASLFVVIYRIILLTNKDKKMPNWIEILNLSGVTSVMITFLIVACVLAPRNVIEGENYFLMFKGSNLFFHLIIPLVAIFNFLFVEYDCQLKVSCLLFGVLPILAYGIFYIFNFFKHWVYSEFGEIVTYDWYGLLGDGSFLHVALIFISFFIGAYLLTLLLWFFNKGLKNKLIKQ